VQIGGVAYNVAANLAALGERAAIASVIGGDPAGATLLEAARARGIDVDRIELAPNAPSAEYIAFNAPDGELLVGVDDMEIFTRLDAERFARDRPAVERAAIVLLDCNPMSAYLNACIEHRRAHGYVLAVDGVSQAHIRRLPRRLEGIDLLFCNDAEAIAYLGLDAPASSVGRAKALRQRGAQNVVVMRNALGCILSTAAQTLAFPAVPAYARDTTGGGDALIAGTLAALARGKTMIEAVREGTLLAAITIESNGTLADGLTAEVFESNRYRLTDEPVAI
jgi:pseudouridine kinase